MLAYTYSVQKNDYKFLPALYDGVALAVTTCFGIADITEMILKVTIPFATKTFSNSVFTLGADFLVDAGKALFNNQEDQEKNPEHVYKPGNDKEKLPIKYRNVPIPMTQ